MKRKRLMIAVLVLLLLIGGLLFGVLRSRASGDAQKGTESQTTDAGNASGADVDSVSGETTRADKTSSDGQSSDGTTALVTGAVVDYMSLTCENVEAQQAQNAEDSRKEITKTFSISSENGKGYSNEGNTWTITAGGEYTLSGALKGNVVVDAEGEEVTLILADCSITSESAAPITGLVAEKLKIVAQEGSYNELTDARDPEDGDADETVADGAENGTESDETTDGTASDESETAKTPENAGAAIYAACDLTVKGHGALVVTGSYKNGIGTTEDLTIKNLTLKVVASNVALKGNDSVTIEGGEIIAIAASGDGIKTENSKVTEKGNQKGTVSITDAIVNIYAGRDGISSAYDVSLSGSGSVSIDTDTYSEYTEERAEKSGTDLYLILSTSQYDSSKDYYAYFNNGEGTDGVFVKSESSINVYSGRTAYYGLLIQEPSGYDHVGFMSFEAGAEPSLEAYQQSTENLNINSEKNAYVVTAIEEQELSGDWVSLSTDSTGRNGREYSTKGIKAENEVVIDGEITLVIHATDDAIHLNAGTALENGETGIGSFVMNGGTVQLTTADDGVHSDESLTINGGTLIVTTSYEGLEANQVIINGGRSFVYATDDAVNASTSGGGTTPCVTVNGGYLEVKTPSGDTDAIDSNGNYVQNGGFVLVKGGSTMGSVAGSIDVDGSITTDGGCTVACGGICEGPSGNNNAYGTSNASLAAGDYVLTDDAGNTVLSFTLDGNYSGIWISCDTLTEGTTYSLSCGDSQILEWTQEQGTMGSFSSGFGGFGGGFGGGQGGPGGMGGMGGR